MLREVKLFDEDAVCWWQNAPSSPTLRQGWFVSILVD